MAAAEATSRLKLREFIARRAVEDVPPTEIANEWNEGVGEELQITPRRVRVIIGRLRSKLRRDAEDYQEKLAARTLKELEDIAFFDIRNIFVDVDGGDYSVDLSSLSAAEVAAVKQVQIDEHPSGVTSIKVMLVDKVAALRILLNHTTGSGRLSDVDSAKIVTFLQSQRDREGLQRIAVGEPPLVVLMDRLNVMQDRAVTEARQALAAAEPDPEDPN